jgi:hypothetical protein
LPRFLCWLWVNAWCTLAVLRQELPVASRWRRDVLFLCLASVTVSVAVEYWVIIRMLKMDVTNLPAPIAALRVVVSLMLFCSGIGAPAVALATGSKRGQA